MAIKGGLMLFLSGFSGFLLRNFTLHESVFAPYTKTQKNKDDCRLRYLLTLKAGKRVPRVKIDLPGVLTPCPLPHAEMSSFAEYRAR